MRIVKVVAKTKASPQVFWNKIIDVKNWNQLIMYVKFIKLEGEVKERSKFYDLTTIIWFPALVHHKITKIEKHKKFYMEAYMPFNNGKMIQTIDIEKRQGFNYITMQIKFNINFFLFDFIFGPILEIRLKKMIVGTLEKLKSTNKEYKNSEIIK
jgi:hypothetical protein